MDRMAIPLNDLGSGSICGGLLERATISQLVAGTPRQEAVPKFKLTAAACTSSRVSEPSRREAYAIGCVARSPRTANRQPPLQIARGTWHSGGVLLPVLQRS